MNCINNTITVVAITDTRDGLNFTRLPLEPVGGDGDGGGAGQFSPT